VGPVGGHGQRGHLPLHQLRPQHARLNRRTWLALEDYILNNADNHDLKVTVFTGPVFRADDMTYRGVYRLPAEFWKVVVMVKEDRRLSATAYLQTQKNLLEDLEFAYGPYRTYQVAVSRIEAITGLDFGRLRAAVGHGLFHQQVLAGFEQFQQGQ